MWQLAPMGTDERRFWVPPDGCGGLGTVMCFGIGSEVEDTGCGSVGTDMRWFCGPPNPWLAFLAEVVALVQIGFAGTDQRAFRVPPNGSCW